MRQTDGRTDMTKSPLKLEVLPHPPYSPDLATRDFHMFWPLKNALCGRDVTSDDDTGGRGGADRLTQ